MKTKILIAVLIIGCIVGCKKNAYNTKPTIVLKSVSTDVVPISGNLVIQLQVTDKEGDVTDPALLFIRKLRLNQKLTPILANDSLYYKIPAAPSSQDGTIQLNLDYNNFLASAITPSENDTIQFKFALIDQAGNVSDTISTNSIVVIRL